MKIKTTDILNFIASNLGFTPTGGISATDVQAAIAEVDSEKVTKTGDTMTGRLTISLNSGTIPTPPPPCPLHILGPNAAYNMVYHGFGGGVNFLGQRSNGTMALPTVPGDGASLLQFSGGGWDGVGYTLGRGAVVISAHGTWSGTNNGSRIVFFTTNSGTTTQTEKVRFSEAGSIQMGGANTVINEDRHHQLRSYTVAGLPSSATAAQMIYVSNESGGAVPAFSDGTNWRRVTDRAIVT